MVKNRKIAFVIGFLIEIIASKAFAAMDILSALALGALGLIIDPVKVAGEESKTTLEDEEGNEYPITTHGLKSKGIGQKLITLLWVGLALSAVSLAFSLLEVSASSIYYANLELIDGLVALFILPITLVIIILFLIWMYRLHFDLSNIFPGYPISPGGALARLIIPIYNIWGIWNTFATIAEHFKREAEPGVTHAGESLRFWLPLFYIAIIASNITGRLALRGTFSSGDVAPILFLAQAISDVFLSVVWLQMARIIFSGTNNLDKRKSEIKWHR